MKLRSLPRRIGAAIGAMAALGLLIYGLRAAAQTQTVCAAVKLQISQEAAREREAFEASLTIDNARTDAPLTNFKVQITVKDEAGNPADGAFFIKISSLNGTGAVDGS